MQALIKPRNHAKASRPTVTQTTTQTIAAQENGQRHHVARQNDVRTARVTTAPALNRHSYEQLIAVAASLYAQGHRTIHIDLQQTTQIEQSGLFALYCVHLIFQGEALPGPEMGMGALRYATERVQPDGAQSVCLLNVPEQLRPLIRRTGFAIENVV